MSFLNKLAIGSLAAFALFRSKKTAARTPAVAAPEPERAAAAPAKPRRKTAKRRTSARRVKTA